MTFDDLDDLLADKNLFVNPSELHGIFCGRISAGERLDDVELDRLLIDLLDVGLDVLDELGENFRRLYSQCLLQIQHQGFDFTPLLPSDDVPLQERAESLSEWCQGYLFGLGAVNKSEELSRVDEVSEVLKDLTAFASLRGEDADDDDEASYTELVEYVRAAVLLVHAHLDRQQGDQRSVLH